MPERLSPEQRRTMQAVKGKRTGLERKVVAMLAGAKIKGWELNPKDIQGRPDIAFRATKVCIFVNGCFWHGCLLCARPLPLANRDYWAKKIQRNVDRDTANTALLESMGWKVLHIWEHQLRTSEQMNHILQTVKSLLAT